MRLIGIDVGGTFTDTVLIDGDEIYSVKTKSTDGFITGIINGVKKSCERAGISLSEVDVLSHGSTVAVNALIEKDGAKTALLTTKGFRDVLEIGEAHRDASLLYNPCGEKEPPLIPRRRRYGVKERIKADGQVKTPLDLDDVDRIIEDIRGKDVEAIAVTLLHSYRNDEHERKIADRIRSRMPDVDVSMSADVSPEIREYSRTSTTGVDAYIKPKVSTYLSQLESELEELGLETSINIMKSDGGLARPTIASERPVTQIISGPVAGVKAAQHIGRQIGVDDILTLDMGGTSCDTAMIEDGTLIEIPHREIHGMKINGPFTNIITAGAGGGSIAWLNEVDALRVGPESAGANPGPVCYGRGGTKPTVTDADLVLGLLNPDNFAGGSMKLDYVAAREALRTEIAEPLEMTVEEAAVAVRDIIDNEMASAIRVISVNEGSDPRDFALMGFGGAGPMHACNVAAELGIETIIFPNNPGVHSAMGMLVSDIRHEYTHSLIETVDEADSTEITVLITDMVEQAHEDLDRENVDSDDRQFSVSFDMMYQGQAHYLNVPMSGLKLTEESLKEVIEMFEHDHEDQYGFLDKENSIELVNIRVVAEGNIEDPDFQKIGASETKPISEAKIGTRPVIIDDETTVETPYYEWSQMGTGNNLDGPSIVELENSLVWIPPEFEAHIDEYKNLIATRR